MPSMHEPGGISQLEALACGCFVIARATGGLRDTIRNLRIEKDRLVGNGIVFSDYAPWALCDALSRFSRLYKSLDDTTIQLARNDMISHIYDWRIPAEKYMDMIYSMKEIARR